VAGDVLLNSRHEIADPGTAQAVLLRQEGRVLALRMYNVLDCHQYVVTDLANGIPRGTGDNLGDEAHDRIRAMDDAQSNKRWLFLAILTCAQTG
jgi:hypothetical protein